MLSYLVLLILAALSISAQNCQNPVRRPEIRELSSTQLSRFINATRGLRNVGGIDRFTQFTNWHINAQSTAHGVPAFFTWHREFLKQYELALQSIDRSVVLPYWDWSRDSQAPETSIVFSSNYFGGNGRPGDRCVSNGPFANFLMTAPNRHCLRRNFDEGSTISSFYSGEAIEAIILRSRTYNSFRSAIEGAPHGSVHVGIGGSNGDLSYMYSPNDPFFYLHHTFIDLIYAEWQARNPTLANTYNGRASGRTVSSNDILSPFNVRVSATFNTRSTRYCYYYRRWSANSNRVASALTQNNLRRRHNSNPKQKDNPGLKLGKLINLSIGRGRARNLTFIKENTLSPSDRRHRGKLRLPKPLPNSYIAMNNLDSTEVRETEGYIAEIFANLNTMSDFVPYSSL